MSIQQAYKGRFAPSPTGMLHFGSLIAATGSYLQAKHQHGQWSVRIDDIDPLREQPGAADAILKTLECFGFEWDGEVLYQSNNLPRYQSVVNDLLDKKLAYPCSCSRRRILQKTGQTKGKIIYPGFCRDGVLEKSSEYTIRIQCNNERICFDDAIQGPQEIHLAKTNGDFILQRRDHYYSYHLASGIDDAEQGITEVVRGADLLACTPCHLYVQASLNVTSPQYCHLPVAVNETGQKLSKQNYAAPIKADKAPELLYQALTFLGQIPPRELLKANQNDIWNWAISHWRLDLVPKISHQTINKELSI